MSSFLYSSAAGRGLRSALRAHSLGERCYAAGARSRAGHTDGLKAEKRFVSFSSLPVMLG